MRTIIPCFNCKTPLGLFGEKTREILEALFIQPDMDKMAEFGIRPDECNTFDYNHLRPFWKILAIGQNHYAPYMMLSALSKEIMAVGTDFNGEIVLHDFHSEENGKTGYAAPKDVNRAKKLIKIRLPKFVKDMRYFVEQAMKGVSEEQQEKAPVKVYTHYGEVSVTMEELDCFAAIVENGFEASDAIEKKYGKAIVESIVGKPLDLIMTQRNMVLEQQIKKPLEEKLNNANFFGMYGCEKLKAFEEAIRSVYKEVVGESPEAKADTEEEVKFLVAYSSYSHYTD